LSGDFEILNIDDEAILLKALRANLSYEIGLRRAAASKGSPDMSGSWDRLLRVELNLVL